MAPPDEFRNAPDVISSHLGLSTVSSPRRKPRPYTRPSTSDRTPPTASDTLPTLSAVAYLPSSIHRMASPSFSRSDSVTSEVESVHANDWARMYEAPSGTWNTYSPLRLSVLTLPTLRISES